MAEHARAAANLSACHAMLLRGLLRIPIVPLLYITVAILVELPLQCTSIA